MAEPNLEHVRHQMDFMATHGQHAWRSVPGADIAFLVSLPAVQSQLATGEREIDPDLEFKAILAAVTVVINQLPQPYRDAAIHQFGFADLDPETARKKGAREIAAAKEFGVKQRMYEKPTAKYGGMSRRDYLIGLIATGLCSPTQQALSSQSHEAPSTESKQPATPTKLATTPARLGKRSAGAIVGVAVAAFLGWLFAYSDLTHKPSSGHRTTSTPSLPQLNSDASCPEIQRTEVDNVRRGEVLIGSPGQLQAGPSSIKARVLPRGRYTTVLAVSKGEELELSMSLFDSEYASVQDVVVQARTIPYGRDCLKVTAITHSRTNTGGDVTLGPLLIALPSRPAVSLRYVPNSTVLFGDNDKNLGRLPDGITGVGAPIPYQIPAGSGYFVNFRMRVV